jgi:hypothetical protein
VNLVHRVLKETQVSKVLVEKRATRAHKGLLVKKALQDLRDLKVLKGTLLLEVCNRKCFTI